MAKQQLGSLWGQDLPWGGLHGGGYMEKHCWNDGKSAFSVSEVVHIRFSGINAC